ncbi:hypothetical protein E2C01_050813 [Portunus trituberculatus]|uniref:Uncharacterized protein n=1 Tax=Portunus trituberculatus TaxID=210409 RepID=A0A5B7GHX6_PORTR|nr:hypothetical protein [Portunus trituberculatus]
MAIVMTATMPQIPPSKQAMIPVTKLITTAAHRREKLARYARKEKFGRTRFYEYSPHVSPLS